MNWNPAQVNDIPDGFPIEINEMRGREGYGTNTFFRVSGGWLYSTDLWHYDGEFAFVTDDGKVDRFAPDYTTNAAFIIDSQFGVTSLGQDVFAGGDGGTLARLERSDDGSWTYEPLLELPSEAFGYAFAPDGTLLVQDPYGAVAITSDRRIWPLSCAE